MRHHERTWSLILAPLLALSIAVIALLVLPAGASAHTLSVNKAQGAVTKAAKREADRNGFRTGSASDCSRKGHHKVGCKAHLEDRYEPGLGAMATCTYDATARYRSRTSKQIVVLFSSGYECTYDYGGGGGGSGDTTAPETTITSGPANGSIVPAEPGIPARASVNWEFTASEPSFFECRPIGPSGFGDPTEWWPCSSPAPRTYDLGPNTFEVRATDYAGNVDPTPAARSFTVQ